MRPITFDIHEMIQLFASGTWTYSALGRRYGKDHTSIMHHVKKLGLVKHQPIPPQVQQMKFVIEVPEEEILAARVAPKYQHLLEESRACPGKSYKEYLAEALKRPVERRYYKTYYGHYKNPKVSTTTLITAYEEEEGGASDPESARVAAF